MAANYLHGVIHIDDVAAKYHMPGRVVRAWMEYNTLYLHIQTLTDDTIPSTQIPVEMHDLANPNTWSQTP